MRRTQNRVWETQRYQPCPPWSLPRDFSLTCSVQASCESHGGWGSERQTGPEIPAASMFWGHWHVKLWSTQAGLMLNKSMHVACIQCRPLSFHLLQNVWRIYMNMLIHRVCVPGAWAGNGAQVTAGWRTCLSFSLIAVSLWWLFE